MQEGILAALFVDKKRIESRLQALKKLDAIVKELASTVQNDLMYNVSSLVTKCLNLIFGESAYSFRLNLVEKRGQLECVLFFERDGIEVDPLTASGGGVVDVASFALRVCVLQLTRPKIRKLLVLDEPFRFLSSEYRKNVGALLGALSSELCIQFLIVTHFDELRLGEVVQL